MSTRPFFNDDEELEDFTDVPLKLHSVMEFLDNGVASVDGATEHQHVSSTDSESEEDTRGSETPNSLRLTPFISATAQPRQCFCMDKAKCMCSLFTLPPLLTRRLSTPTALVGSLNYAAPLSSSHASDGAVPVKAATVVEGVCFIPLNLTDVHLSKPLGVAPAPSTTAPTRTSTLTTCCRC